MANNQSINPEELADELLGVQKADSAFTPEDIAQGLLGPDIDPTVDEGEGFGPLRKAGIAAGGFATGLAAGFGLPPELQPDPEGLAEGELEPRTAGETVLRRVSQEAGAAFPTALALPVVGARAAIQRTTPIVTKGIDSLKNQIALFLRDIGRQDLGKLLATEAALAGVSGTGAGVAQLAFPDNRTAEFAGQLGPIVGAAGTIKALRGIRSFVGKRLPPLTESAAKEEAGRILDQVMSDNPQFIDNLIEAERLKGKFPGFDPTSAQATGEPGLIALERSTVRKNPEAVNEFSLKQAESTRALRDKLESAFDIEEAPAELQGRLRQMIDDDIRKIDESTMQAVDRSETLIRESKVPQTRKRSGEIIRQAFEDETSEFRLQANRLFDSVDPERQVTLDITGINKSAREVAKEIKKTPAEFPNAGRILKFIQRLGKVEGAEDIISPEQVRTGQTFGLVEEAGQAVKPVSFEEVRNLRSDILTAIRGNPNANERRLLNQVLDGVESSLDSLSRDGRFPEAAGRYETARAHYRAGVERLKQGEAGMMLKKTGTGEFKVPPSQIVKSFFKSGKNAPEAAQGFIKAVGSRPAALRALEGEVTNSFLNASFNPKTGRFDIGKARRWQSAHSEALREFPSLADKVDGLTRSQEGLQQIIDFDANRLRIIDQSSFSKFVGLDADKALAMIGKDKKLTQALVRTVKNDKSAMRSLQRSVWKNFTNSAEGRAESFYQEVMLNPQKMKQFMKENRAILQEVYTPRQLKFMDDLQKGAAILKRTEKPPIAGGSDTAQNLNLAKASATMASRAFAVKRGVLGLPFVATEFVLRNVAKGMQGLTENQLKGVMEEAMFNPEVMKTVRMLTRKGVDDKIIARRMRAHVAALGLESRIRSSGGEEE
jgi:hypothetical protein